MAAVSFASPEAFCTLAGLRLDLVELRKDTMKLREELDQLAPLETESMCLFVKSLSGKSISVNVDASGTVFDLKKAVEREDDTPVEQQRLLFGGKQLEDNNKLSDYNLKDDCSVHLVLRLRGGMYAPSSGHEDLDEIDAKKHEEQAARRELEEAIRCEQEEIDLLKTRLKTAVKEKLRAECVERPRLEEAIRWNEGELELLKLSERELATLAEIERRKEGGDEPVELVKLAELRHLQETIRREEGDLEDLKTRLKTIVDGEAEQKEKAAREEKEKEKEQEQEPALLTQIMVEIVASKVVVQGLLKTTADLGKRFDALEETLAGHGKRAAPMDEEEKAGEPEQKKPRGGGDTYFS